MGDKHCARRAALELGGRLLLFEIEAPRNRGHGDATAEPKELGAPDLGNLAVEHAGTGPVGAGPPKRRVRLVVAGDKNRRYLEAAERLKRALEPQPDRREIPGADQNIRVRRQLGEPLSLSTVAV